MALQYPPYQPSFYGVQQTPAFNPVYPQSQTSQSNVIWVQGEAAAKAYPVQAGNSMILLDSENDCFYIKSSDNAGMPNRLRKFEYKEVLEGQVVQDTPVEQPQYITKEEFEKAMNELKHQSRYNNNNRKGDRNEQPV
jgi:hypothetical protein